jgi:hypothetical protein
MVFGASEVDISHTRGCREIDMLIVRQMCAKEKPRRLDIGVPDGRGFLLVVGGDRRVRT